MKRLYVSALILFLLCSILIQEKTFGYQLYEQGLSRVGQKYVPGEFLVKFKANVTESEIADLNSNNNVSTIYTSLIAGFRRLAVPDGTTVDEMVEIYQADSKVEYAEANYIANALLVPNDDLYYRQWHLYNTNYGGIEMESAWDISTGSGVNVAILDTGVAYEDYCEEENGEPKKCYEQAPDLVNTSFLAGYDFVNQDEHPNDDSNPGHGTHIAGTIAQNTNNSSGTAGVAYNANIMPVKVLDSKGAGSYADIAEGIIWAADQGAHVINLGLGGSEPSKTFENALEYAYNLGVTLVAAAGNEGAGSMVYPAAYDDYVIAVGATRYDETIAYYSNFGLSLDIVAPGGDINVDQNGDSYGDGVLQQTYGNDGDEINWGYTFMEGTSMAAAHVSAAAALITANGNATTPAEVKEALESTAKDKGAEGWDIEYGSGILDVYAALQWNTTEDPPKPPPSQTETLEAIFTADPNIGPEPLTVQFTDQSTGNVTSWLWDFGDGTTSIEQNPTHEYTDARTYTVRLTVYGPDGSNTKTRAGYIRVFIPSTPRANFAIEPISANSPTTIRFLDQSTCPAYIVYGGDGSIITGTIESAPYGGITSWEWDFGDGTTSTEQNPVHTYQEAGTFDISLRVRGPGGSDSIIMRDYITLTLPQAPTASFLAAPSSGDSPLVVQFADTSTGHITSWLWDFGDGTTSTEQHPTHTYRYRDSSAYTVSLTVEGLGGSDTETKADLIQLDIPPINVSIGITSKQEFRTWYTVTSVVTVTDNDTGQRLGGVTIEGTWSGAYGGTVSGTTNGNGQAFFTTDWVTRGAWVTFTIDKVKIGEKEYQFTGTNTASIRP
ncbi:MAG: S8 family serine peptidase [Phycisphaerales bacterium]|jgi:serine protease